MITRTVTGIGYSIPRKWDTETTSIAEHAIQAFGFIVPIRTPITWPQFAKLITQYSDSERAQLIAKTIST